MFGMGAQELMVILVIVLVLFGGSKLPDLAKSLGKSMKEFKKGIATEDEEHAAKPAPSNAAKQPWMVREHHKLRIAHSDLKKCLYLAVAHIVVLSTN